MLRRKDIFILRKKHNKVSIVIIKKLPLILMQIKADQTWKSLSNLLALAKRANKTRNISISSDLAPLLLFHRHKISG